MPEHTKPDLSKYASKLIRCKARQLIGHFGLTQSDCEDVEQDLAVHLIEHMGQFDPSRGSENTFVSRIIDRKVVSISRHRTALRRNYCRVRSIEDTAGGDEHSVNAALVVEESPPDLAIDLAGAIETFDSDSQRFSRMGMAGSVMDAARGLGLTRGAARGRIVILRRLLTDAGLEVYLKA